MTVRLFGTATTAPPLKMQLRDLAQVSHRPLWERATLVAVAGGPASVADRKTDRDGPLRFGSSGINSARESGERFVQLVRIVVGL